MEIFLILLQVFLQFFGELLLYIFGEMLTNALIGGVAQLLRFSQPASFLDRPTKTHPIVVACGSGLLGGLVGGLTLLVFPAAFVQNPSLRAFNLFFSPVLVGLLLVMLGTRQPQSLKPHRLQPIDSPTHRQDRTEVYRFLWAFVFAFAIALVRFLWAH